MYNRKIESSFLICNGDFWKVFEESIVINLKEFNLLSLKKVKNIFF